MLPLLDLLRRRLLRFGQREHVQGQGAQRAVEIVAQGEPGQGVPPVAALELGDRGEHQVQTEVLAQRVVELGHLLRLALRDIGRLHHVQQAVDVQQPDDALGQPARGTAVDVGLHLSGHHLGLGTAQPALHPRGQRMDLGREPADLRPHGEWLRSVGDQPARGPVEQPTSLQRQVVRQLRRHPGLQTADLGPDVGQVEHRGCGGVRAYRVGHRRPRLLGQPEGVGDAAGVHHLVHHHRRHDLPAQRVGGDCGREALRQRVREVVRQTPGEHVGIGQLAGQHLVLEGQLHLCHEDRHLRRGEPLPRLGHRPEPSRGRQGLQRAVKTGQALQVRDQPRVHPHHVRTVGPADPHELVLVGVVGEHQPGHLVGHRLQQRVAVGRSERAVGDQRVEQDLDVHLVVGAVDPGRVVQGVSVDLSARAVVLDAPALGETEVAALPHHLHA